MLALRLRFARTKKISVSAYHLYKKPGISGEKSNETVHHGRNVSKKKLKPSKVLLTFLSFTETTENILYHCCMWITNATPPPEGTRKISFFFFFFFFLRAQLNPTPILGAKTIPVIFVEKSFTEISSQMLKAIRRLKDISAKESRSY